jgi:hypothetical protein
MTSARPRLAAVRRAVGTAAVLFILGSAVVFYRVSPHFPSSGLGSTTARQAVTQPTGPASTSVGTPSPASRQSAATKPSSNTRPGVNSVGILLSAASAADGSFDVAESIILSTPITTLQLRMPPIIEGGQSFGSMHPRATTVQISADKQPVAVPSGEVTGDLSLPLALPATKVELRYRLTGVTMRTVGSIPGRALGALGPIVAGVPPDLPVAITVRGRTVLNLQCPHLQKIGDQACSAGTSGNLRVKRLLPWQQSIIVVQLNLPRR